MEKVIFIDLDGTLTLKSTWGLFNIRFGLTHEEDQELFDQYVAGTLTYKDWTARLVELYKAHGVIHKKDILDFIEEIDFQPDALSTIQALQEKGYRLVVVSGSIDLFVEVLAQKLGINEYLACSQVFFDANDIFTNMTSLGDEAPAKLKLVTEYANTHGFKLENAYSIDDGGNGIELFKHTKGILVGNNEKLKTLAWKQVGNLSEIVELI